MFNEDEPALDEKLTFLTLPCDTLMWTLMAIWPDISNSFSGTSSSWSFRVGNELILRHIFWQTQSTPKFWRESTQNGVWQLICHKSQGYQMNVDSCKGQYLIIILTFVEGVASNLTICLLINPISKAHDKNIVFGTSSLCSQEIIQSEQRWASCCDDSNILTDTTNS